ncbi:ABC transporter permease [Methylocaldum szegediense]|uniref:Lipopolysaccharide transport system permease protein n=1 Tax=Methylocaldum szegediense TaxID=73780 RepID=A0ABM9HXG6_9GAMM|nr:ABC transporter permease [Methylocaldum szegediense]CAI8751916.1 Lipopolysaccharide transport system permease protein [Methylocaldum szegediense]
MRTYTLTTALNVAWSDIKAATKRYSLVGMLGWQDVRQRYRRSFLGPFWLTVSMAVMIGTIGVVFGQIFSSPMTEFLPFLAAGIIFWGFMSSIINEGCTSFISAEAIIKQLPFPLFVHILRMVWRNILLLAHNFVIFPLALLVVGKPLNWLALISIPGFLLVIINLTWVALILSVLCTRYRDLPQMVGNLLQVLFYLTPVIWMPTLLPKRAGLFFLDANPAYHLLELIRSPLLGQMPSLTNWVVSLALAFAGWSIALAIYGRFKCRIAYWL